MTYCTTELLSCYLSGVTSFACVCAEAHSHQAARNYHSQYAENAHQKHYEHCQEQEEHQMQGGGIYTWDSGPCPFLVWSSGVFHVLIEESVSPCTPFGESL